MRTQGDSAVGVLCVRTATGQDCATALRLRPDLALPASSEFEGEDLWNAEGICYLLWCDPCAISAVVYQQT